MHYEHHIQNCYGIISWPGNNRFNNLCSCPTKKIYAQMIVIEELREELKFQRRLAEKQKELAEFSRLEAEISRMECERLKLESK